MAEKISASSLVLWTALRKELSTTTLLRPANRMDIPALVPLINNAYMYENIGEKAFKLPEALRTDPSALESTINNGVVIVAADLVSGRIYGCVHYKEMPASEGSGSDQDTNAYFGMLAVDPQFQGKEHGRRLLRAAEEIARQRGKHVMEIQVVNHSQNLLELYGKKGYKPFGRSEWNAPFLTKPTHFILMSKPLQPALNPAA